MDLQVIGIFIQAYLLAKILTVQAPALKDKKSRLHLSDEQIMTTCWLRSDWVCYLWCNDEGEITDQRKTVLFSTTPILAVVQILINIDNHVLHALLTVYSITLGPLKPLSWPLLLNFYLKK